MKFRRNMFRVLTVLAVLWMIVWIATASSAADEQRESDATELDAAITDTAEGIAVSLICVIMAPIIAVFALLAWRNAAGLRTEQRHQEMMQAQ